MLLNKTGRKILSIACFMLLAFTISFTACDIGLGEIVNTSKPTIAIPDDGIAPGAFLEGDHNLIELDVQQPYGMSEVYMIVKYICSETGEEKEKRIDAVYNKATDKWVLNLDTTGMADGSIRTQVTAVDRSGRQTVSTEIIYMVKNMPPTIELLIPKISGVEFDNPGLNDTLDPIYSGGFLLGKTEDSYGIAKGYPQIRLWPAPDNAAFTDLALDQDGYPLESDPVWGKWRTVMDNNDNYLAHTNNDLLKAAQFRWPLNRFYNDTNTDDPLPAGKYRFQIRVADCFNPPKQNQYPARADTNDPNPVNYIEINLIATDNPIIKFTASHPDAVWLNNTTVSSPALSVDGDRISFPQYYNGEGDFGEYIFARITITAGNPIEKIFAKMSNSEVSGFNEDNPALDSEYENYVIEHANNAYFIRMSKQKIEQMLNTTEITGEKMLHVRVIDTQGNESNANRMIIIDAIPPGIEFIQPQGLGTLDTPHAASTLIIRGSTHDNNQVESLHYALGKTEVNNGSLGLTWNNHNNWINTGLGQTAAHAHPGYPAIRSEWSGTFSAWNWRFTDIIDFCGADVSSAIKNYFLTDLSNNRWELPIKFKIVDKARNVSIIETKIILDPDLDIPTAQINSHTSMQTVGGKVNINGTATDNEWINNVEIRVSKVVGAGFANVVPYNGNFIPAENVGSRSSTVSWSHTVNTDSVWEGEYRIEIRARDSYLFSQNEAKPFRTNGSDIKSINLIFDSGVPLVNMTIIHGTLAEYNAASASDKISMETAFVPGISSMVRGKITVKAEITDDKQINSIQLRNFPNGAGWSGNYLEAGFPSAITNQKISEKDYIMYIPIDTTGIANNAIYTMDIEALDNTSPVAFRTQTTLSIIADNAPPELLFIEPLQEPAQRPSVTGRVIIRGSVTDNQKVSKMWYALGKTASDAVMCKHGAGCEKCVDGNDPNGPVATSSVSGWVDAGFPASPTQNHPESAGVIRSTWSGTFASWEWRFENIADFVLSSGIQTKYVTSHPGNNLWLLPIKFMVMDEARNFRIVQIELILDPDRDQPEVSVTSHNNSQTVGGPIRINGTATDNEMIAKVEYRIIMQSDANCDTANTPTEYPLGNSTIWQTANIPSHDTGNYTSTVSWFVNLNADQVLTPPSNKNIRVVWVEFRAWDSAKDFITQPVPKQYPGQTTRLMLQFDRSFPVILDERIFFGQPTAITNATLTNPAGGVLYEPGMKLKGQVVMRVTVRDEQKIDNVRIRAGSLNVDVMNTSTTINNTQAWKTERTQDKEYYVFIPMNTTAAQFVNNTTQFGIGHENNAVIYNLSIQVQDDTTPAPYLAQSSYALEIDNRTPQAKYTGDTFARGNRFAIAGEVWDNGTDIRVHGVERIVVYMTRNDQIIDLHGGNAGSASIAANNTAISARQNVTGNENAITSHGSVNTSIPFPRVENAGVYRSTVNGIVIDGGVGGVDWTDSYNTVKNFTGTGHIRWSVEFDTTKTGLSDGRYNLNYVAFDKAGNATHYSSDVIYIANNQPRITSVSLGTDINGDGSIASNEFMNFHNITNTQQNTNFRIRNRTFTLRLTASPSSKATFNGNYLYYDVFYAVPVANQTALVKGRVYTIETTGTNIPWNNYGVFGTAATGYTFTATANASLTDTGASVTRYDLLQTALTGAVAANETQKRGQLVDDNTVSNPAIAFLSNAFNSTTAPIVSNLIPDSDKANGDITGTNRNKRFFIVRVYDQTISDSADAEQLSNVTLIALDIDNTDQKPPVITVNPFGGEYNNNIITTGAGESLAKKGYVQYAGSGINAYVSGKIVITGTVSDNRRVGRITVAIPGFNSGNQITVAQGSATTGDAFTLPASANTIALMSTDGAANRWGFEITDQSISIENGQVVSWKFAWDSSSINNADNVGIVFRVFDDVTGNGNMTGSPAAAPSSTMTVNVVPYITEIETQLNSAMSATPSAFNRSSTGWYPVREGEVITIRGFNFYNGTDIAGYTGAAVPTVQVPTATATVNLATSQVDAPAGEAANSPMRLYRMRTQVRATVSGANQMSGKLTVTRGVASINNTNDNTQIYNHEPNNLNNNLLTDDRNLYIWNIGHLVNRSTMLSPIMRMSANGTRYVTFVEYISGTGQFHLLQNNVTTPASTGTFPTARTLIESSGNRYVNPTLAVDTAGNWYGGVSNISSSADYQTYFAFHARGASHNTDGYYQAGDNKRRILPLYSNGVMEQNRVRFPRIFADTSGTISDTNVTRLLMSYFDGHNSTNPVIFQYGLVAAAITSQANGVGNGTGGQLGDYEGNRAQSNNNTGYQQTVADDALDSTHKGSMYTAVGALANGLPVVAWYDRTNRNLVISHGAGTPAGRTLTGGSSANDTSTGTSWVTTTKAQWQANAKLLHEGAGTHVDMAIADDNIHLAYYDATNGGLYYAFIPHNGSANRARKPVFNNAKIVRVDTYLSAGVKLMINVRDGIPYITYFHSSFAETRNSIRIAWPKVSVSATAEADLHGTYKNHTTHPDDSFTGVWEVMTIPIHADSIPKSEEYICNGVPTTNWTRPTAAGAVGYTGDLTKSILVGYMTNQWYEGAVLRTENLNLP